MELHFPYGKETLSIDIEDKNLQGVLVSSLHDYTFSSCRRGSHESYWI